MRQHAFKTMEENNSLKFCTVIAPCDPLPKKHMFSLKPLEAQSYSSLNYEKETYLTSFSTIPSSEGTPTLIAFVSSGSS